MTILPDISVHSVNRQVHQVLLSVDLDALTDDELVEGAHQMLHAGTACHIAAGRFFIAMKQRFSGRFLEIVRMKFDQSPDVIEALMAIAREFPDHNMWSSLPSCWTTLERLTRISQEVRDRWISDGTIHPRLTHAEARELVQRARALDDDDDPDGDHDNDRDSDDGGGDDLGGDQDDDHGGDDRDAEQDGDDHSKPRTDSQPAAAGQVVVARKNSDTSGDAEIERLQAHIEEQNAYIERLKAEAEFSERENETLKRRNAELEAMIGLDVGRSQRSLLSHAIETAQKAIKNSKDGSNERRRLQGGVGAYIIDIVRTAKVDDLDVERFDLAYRPKVEENLPRVEGESSESSALLGAEAHLQ